MHVWCVRTPSCIFKAFVSSLGALWTVLLFIVSVRYSTVQRFTDFPVTTVCLDGDTTSTISFYGVWLQIIMMPCQKCNTLSLSLSFSIENAIFPHRLCEFGEVQSIYTKAYRLQFIPRNLNNAFFKMYAHYIFHYNGRQYFLLLDFSVCQCENLLCVRNNKIMMYLCKLYAIHIPHFIRWRKIHKIRLSQV